MGKSIAKKDHSDPVLQKIDELVKKIPHWAIIASKKMNLSANTIREIRRGTKGITNDRALELLEVLTDVKKDRELKIKKLTA